MRHANKCEAPGDGRGGYAGYASPSPGGKTTAAWFQRLAERYAPRRLA